MPSFDSQTKKPHAKTPKEREKVRELLQQCLWKRITLHVLDSIKILFNCLINVMFMNRLIRFDLKKLERIKFSTTYLAPVSIPNQISVVVVYYKILI